MHALLLETERAWEGRRRVAGIVGRVRQEPFTNNVSSIFGIFDAGTKSMLLGLSDFV